MRARARLGIFLTALGGLLIMGAVFLFAYESKEAEKAERAARELMPKLISQIKEKNEEGSNKDTAEDTVSIDGNDYIGYIKIPKLYLTLPVMSDWSYEKLKTAPCRFSGSLSEESLIIMAHNYKRHFGALDDLDAGDSVQFIDTEGNITDFKVELKELISADSVDKMKSGDYPLTLFTCTYTKKNRITVRCSYA